MTDSEMPTTFVVAYFGDAVSNEAIAHLSAHADVSVVAVVFDFGQRASLSALRASALAAGAVRCHALDVRDAYARDVVFRAARDVESMEALRERTSAFV